MPRCFIPEAIARLFPGESPLFTLDGESLDGLTWQDPVLTQPTDEEITAELAAAEADWDATAYLRARAAGYAAQGITTEAVAWAIYEARVNSNTTPLNAIAAKRAVVDEDNPVPAEG